MFHQYFIFLGRNTNLYIFGNYYFMKKNFLLVVFLIFTIRAIPQSVFPVNGIKKVDNDVFVFKNANINIDENTVLNNAILIVSKGKIVDVVSSV